MTFTSRVRLTGLAILLSLSCITSAQIFVATPIGESPEANTFDYPGIPYPSDTATSELTTLGYTAWGYDPLQDTPDLPDPWTSNEVGFHYVESGGTNSGNGYPGDPAGSYPGAGDVSAGDVVVVSDAGGSFGSLTVTYTCTSVSPCFVVAAAGDTPTHTGDVDFGNSAHLIVRGFTYNTGGANPSVSIDGTNVVLRNSTINNTYDTSPGSVIGVTGCDHCLIFSNSITGGGNTANVDHHCITVGDPTTELWIIDNTFRECSGDALQTGGSNSQNVPADITYVFYAGNDIEQANQSCGWIKNATDVVYSSNICKNQNGGSQDACLGAQYDGSYLWFIFNQCYDTDSGIIIESIEGVTSADYRYIYGNVLHDIVNASASPSNPHQSSPIKNRAGSGVLTWIESNTLHGNTLAINVPNGTSTTVRNNIIGDPLNGTARHIYNTDSSSSAGEVDCNWYEGSTQRIQWGGGDWTLVQFVANTPHGDNGVSGTDPLFTNEAADDYSLQSSSTAVDACGTTELDSSADFNTRYGMDINVDFAGTGKPQNTNYDMGAYER